MLFFFEFFLFLLLVFQVFLGPNIRFVLKMNSDSDVRYVSVPTNYEHRDFPECAFLAVCFPGVTTHCGFIFTAR